MKAGKTLLCSPGRGGTHIGHLTLTLDGKAGGLKSFRHFLIPLGSEIPEDPDLRRLLAPVTIDPNKWSLDDYDEDYRAQVMAFVRGGPDGKSSDIVLRDLRTDRQYALPSAAAFNTRPILGYGKNKVAFLGQDAPGGPREIYSLELGTQRLDTLTRDSGQALDIRWILGNNALLAAYGKAGSRDLWRIDPWSHERRNIGGGRFGDVSGFDIDKGGDRLAVMGSSGGQSTLWVTSLKMEEPQPVAADRGFLGPPRWNPAGDRLAFMALSGADGGEDGKSGELRVFDFREKKLIPVTLGSRVRDFSWSADGKKLYYVAGVNLLDINAYDLDSLVVKKVTAPSSVPRSEEAPVPKVVDGKDGLLFESTGEDGRRGIRWVDLKTRVEKALADSAGWNSLR
jgi:WD40 repeat protein